VGYLQRHAKGNKVYACLCNASATAAARSRKTKNFTHAHILVLYFILPKVPELPAQYQPHLPAMSLVVHCHNKDVV
jgi:hypothetical protein